MPKQKGTICQLRVTLTGIEPQVWRRLLVAGDIRLDKLHEVIQVAMGWTNSHLHMFHAGGRKLSMPDPEWADVEDERKARLRDVAPKAGDKFVYEYDMGESWKHEIEVERVTEKDARYRACPVCLEGARACPPEDCGGVGGYAEFLEAIRDPKHERHAELLAWVGGHFDPEGFDLKLLNSELRDWKKDGLTVPADAEEVW